jgi:hypothetical protein
MVPAVINTEPSGTFVTPLPSTTNRLRQRSLSA